MAKQQTDEEFRWWWHSTGRPEGVAQAYFKCAQAAWKAARDQVEKPRIDPVPCILVTTEVDGHMVRYAALNQGGPVFVINWAVVLENGEEYAGGGHGPIPLEEAELLWRETIETAKPPEPEPDPGPETLEDAVHLLLEAVDSVLGLDDFYHDCGMEEAAGHVKRILAELEEEPPMPDSTNHTERFLDEMS